MLNFDIRLDSLANEAVSSSGGTSDTFDGTVAVGNLFLNIAARAGGTNTMALAVQHSLDGSTGWDPVPASALFNPQTGDADTFDDVTTAATDQTLGLNRQQLRRYIRVAYTGTSLTHNVAVTMAYQPDYTEF